MFERINDFDIEEFTKNYIKEQEENRWKNEPKYNEFLNYLVNFVKKHKKVTSDNFYYQEKDCKPYTYREFEDYLFSLYDIVDEYGTKNCINDSFNLTSEYFSENSYYLKIKDDFYKIELICGQGSYVFFEVIDSNNNSSYVDYDLMIEDKVSPFYEHNIKEDIFESMSDLVDEFINKGVSKELVISYINDFIKGED